MGVSNGSENDVVWYCMLLCLDPFDGLKMKCGWGGRDWNT